MYARVHCGRHGDPASGAEYSTEQQVQRQLLMLRGMRRRDIMSALNLMNALLPPRVVADMGIHCPCAYTHTHTISFLQLTAPYAAISIVLPAAK